MARVAYIGSGTQPQMVEWSIGMQGSYPGIGILNHEVEPIWRELASVNDIIVFTTNSSILTGELTKYKYGYFSCECLSCKYNVNILERVLVLV